MEKYATLTGSFIKKQYIVFLLITAVFLLFSTQVMSFDNLQPNESAKVMELYINLVGMFLLTPLFVPEQDKEIWNLKSTKAMSMVICYLLRVLLGFILVTIIISGFAVMLYENNENFNLLHLIIGCVCEALFLGCIGYFFSAITNQVVVGYMFSAIYFFANVGADKVFGKFSLTHILKGKNNFEIWMLMGCVVLVTAGIFIREKIKKRLW